MPAFQVSRSIAIQAPVDQVYAYLRDFRLWPEWSPWLISEPECALEYGEDGSWYSWEGKIIGSGKMTVIDRVENERIDSRLEFFKPWKSESLTSLRFDATGETTTVTWSMDGSLPLLMFWMKKLMIAMISADYDRGLAMAKEKLEDGLVRSQLSFGSQRLDAFTFVGVQSECTTDSVGDSIKRDLEKLSGWLDEKGIVPAGKPMSIYHKWDLVNRRATYSAGVPVSEVPSDLPSGMVSLSLPEMEAYTVTHTGAYSHLGNAWSAGIGHGRAKVYRKRKRVPPFEIYENDPAETDPADLITIVNFPSVS